MYTRPFNQIDYDEAVTSLDPNIRKLAIRTAKLRRPESKGKGNFAARSALRQDSVPVYSSALPSYGSYGPALHPDRTTEIDLYNKLIEDPKTKGEWEGLKSISVFPSDDLKKSLFTVEDSNRLLERYRNNFRRQRYRTQLFSELHPCSPYEGMKSDSLTCDPYLRKTLNPEDEVYYTTPYEVGYANRIHDGHLAALEAMRSSVNRTSMLESQPKHLSTSAFAPSIFGPLPGYFSRVPSYVPSDIAKSVLNSSQALPISSQNQSSQSDQSKRFKHLIEQRGKPPSTPPLSDEEMRRAIEMSSSAYVRPRNEVDFSSSPVETYNPNSPSHYRNVSPRSFDYTPDLRDITWSLTPPSSPVEQSRRRSLSPSSLRESSRSRSPLAPRPFRNNNYSIDSDVDSNDEESYFPGPYYNSALNPNTSDRGYKRGGRVTDTPRVGGALSRMLLGMLADFC